MFLVSFLRSEIIIIILTIGVVLFQKRKKKSKSKLDLQICKVNQGIVLFLFGFSPTGHKKFHLPQFSKKIQPNSRGINYKKKFYYSK